MEGFVIYIAKSGICVGIFLIIYVLFLRKTTFFRFNRFFLVTGFIVSLIIPSVKYTYDVVVSIPFIPMVENTVTQSYVEPVATINIWALVFAVYIAGIIVCSARNMYSYRKLLRYIAQGDKSVTREYKLIENQVVKSPFTVLNYILINTNNLSSKEKDLIIKHEITHIRQKHWIDLILGECMLLLQWFNPLIWIYVYLLKENHEYLADRAVINSGVSPALYQAVLINQEFQGPVFSFSNSFNYSKPLNRLSMMKKTRSASWKRLSALIIIPVFGLFVWASAEPRYIIDQQSMEDLITDNTDDDTIKVQVHESKIKTSGDEKNTTFHFVVGKKDSLATNRLEVKAYTANDNNRPVIIVDGKEISELESYPNADDIMDVHIIKDTSLIDPVYAKRAKNGAVIVTTKSNNHKGTPVKIQMQLEQKGNDSIPKIRIVSKGKTKLSGEIGSDNVTVRADTINLWSKVTTFGATKDNPLVILDGEKVAYGEINKIEPKAIDNISVLKDKTSTELYGDDGKNGVIIIETKEYAKANPSSTRVKNVRVLSSKLESKSGGKSKVRLLSPDTKLDDALLIIDGKEETDKKLESLDADNIKSMSIYKGKGAIEKYGDKGKNGVIEITTK